MRVGNRRASLIGVAAALFALSTAKTIRSDDNFELLDIRAPSFIGELRIKTFGRGTKSYFDLIRESSMHVTVHTLAFFDLQSSEFLSLVPEFHSLTILEFRRCKISDISMLLKRQDCVNSLQRVFVIESNIDGDFLASLAEMNKLEFLVVSACKISTNAFQSLCDSKIKYLYCAHTDLNATQVNHIARSKQIVEATIQVSEPTRRQLLQMSQMKKLKKLTIITGASRKKAREFFSEVRPDVELAFEDPLPVVTSAARTN